MKDRFIRAYVWMFGTTKKEAMGAYKAATPEYISAVIEGFENNARKAFYND